MSGPYSNLCLLTPSSALFSQKFFFSWKKLKLTCWSFCCFSVYLESKMCFVRAQCDHSQEFLATDFSITICSGLLMGWRGWGSMTSIHNAWGVVRESERKRSKASSETGTPWEPLEVTLNREEDCQSPGTWQKSNPGALRQDNLEVQGKRNRKWHLIQENVSDPDNKIKLAYTTCRECRILKGILATISDLALWKGKINHILIEILLFDSWVDNFKIDLWSTCLP